VIRRSQLARLLQILLALRGRSAPNARELADLCEVSRRTIYRDLQTLAQAGVPLRYLPEQQGYRLAPGFHLEAPKLEESEAIALVLVAAACTDAEALGRRQQVAAALLKLVQSLPTGLRERSALLCERIVGPGPHGSSVAPRDGQQTALTDVLLEALIQNRQVRLVYRERLPADLVETRLSPYYLQRSCTDWQVVGRSSLHRKVRTFEVSRIVRAALLETAFTLPPRFRSKPAPERGGAAQTERVRLRQPVKPDAVYPPQPDCTALPSAPEGQAELESAFAAADEALPWILSHGPEVEVVHPPELRERVRALALQMAARHRKRTEALDAG
jgi:predicted DNA-binding transcriptional regulator YafY